MKKNLKYTTILIIYLTNNNDQYTKSYNLHPQCFQPLAAPALYAVYPKRLKLIALEPYDFEGTTLARSVSRSL